MNYWVMAFPCLMYLTSVGTCSNRLQHCGDRLTNIADSSNGHRGHLRGVGSEIWHRRRGQPQHIICFDFTCAQRPPYGHDRRTTRPARQECSESHRVFERVSRTAYSHRHSRHDARRVLCALRCRSFSIYCTMGYQQPGLGYLQRSHGHNSGLC